MDIIKNGTKHILFPYQFRPLQKKIISEMGRFAIIVAHRRFGKTMMLLLHMLFCALNLNKKNPKFWYICPQEKQARRNAWDYLKQFGTFIPGSQTHEARLELTFDLQDGRGLCTIGLKGVDQGGDSLRGSYLDGVVLDEMKDMPMNVWTDVIRPMLSDRLGWAVLTGTAGQGPWYDLYCREENNTESEFKIFNYKVTDTDIIDKDEIQSLVRTQGKRKFDREYMNDWMSMEDGAYYADIIAGLDDNGQISTDIKHDPQKPVYTSWDLGASDATAIWFVQERDSGGWNVIDYIEQNRTSLQEMGEKTSGQSFDMIMFGKLLLKPYLYGAHILPHDSVHKHISADLSTYEKFKQVSGGAKIIVAPKLLTEARIQGVQQALHACWFNKIACSRGIGALHSYKAKMTHDGVETSPKHDWASHAADSFGYFITSIKLLNGVRNKFNPKRMDSEVKIMGTWNPLA